MNNKTISVLCLILCMQFLFYQKAFSQDSRVVINSQNNSYQDYSNDTLRDDTGWNIWDEGKFSFSFTLAVNHGLIFPDQRNPNIYWVKEPATGIVNFKTQGVNYNTPSSPNDHFVYGCIYSDIVYAFPGSCPTNGDCVNSFPDFLHWWNESSAPAYKIPYIPNDPENFDRFGNQLNRPRSIISFIFPTINGNRQYAMSQQFQITYVSTVWDGLSTYFPPTLIIKGEKKINGIISGTRENPVDLNQIYSVNVKLDDLPPSLNYIQVDANGRLSIPQDGRVPVIKTNNSKVNIQLSSTDISHLSGESSGIDRVTLEDNIPLILRNNEYIASLTISDGSDAQKIKTTARKFTAFDKVGNVSSCDVTFFYDKADPNLEVQGIRPAAGGGMVVPVFVDDLFNGVNGSGIRIIGLSSDTTADVGHFYQDSCINWTDSANPIIAWPEQQTGAPRKYYNFDVTSKIDLPEPLYIKTIDWSGNCTCYLIDKTAPNNPATYTANIYDSRIEYSNDSMRYVSRLTIPVSSITSCSGQKLKIQRRISFAGANPRTIIGYAESSEPTIGVYEGDDWIIDLNQENRGKMIRQGSDYVIMDLIPAGSLYAHGSTSYTVSLLWYDSDQGQFNGTASVKISNTPPDLSLMFIDGAGKDLLCVTRGGLGGILYCNTIGSGNTKSFDEVTLVNRGSLDPDGDTVAWKIAADGVAEAAMPAIGTVKNIAQALDIQVLSTPKSVIKWLTVSYRETTTDGDIIPGPSSSVPVDIVIDRQAPSITEPFGRMIGSTSVSFTTQRDFQFSLNAEDNETGIGEVRLYLTQIGQTSVAPPQNWVRIIAASTDRNLELSEQQKQEILDGAGLEVEFSGPAYPNDFHDSNLLLPWFLPTDDNEYYFKAEVEDVAGNSAKPVTKIMLSMNLDVNGWSVAIDPNAPGVICLPKDLMPGGAESATVTMQFYVVGLTQGEPTVQAKKTQPDGMPDPEVLWAGVAGAAGVYELSFNVDRYTTYAASVTAASLQDPGATKTSTRNVRVNKPVAAVVPDAETTSGRIVTLSWGNEAAGRILGLSDDGEDGPYSVQWNITDPAGSVITLPSSPFSQNFTFIKYSSAPVEYGIQTVVTDTYGVSSTAQGKMIVRNTSSGRLSQDETWEGDQLLKGTVIVPAGITLRINSGCHVTAVGIPANPTMAVFQNWRIEVESGGRLIMDGAVLDSDGARWGGIRSSGQCTVTNSTIRHAIQGIACAPGSSCSITGATFAMNTVGVQSLASVPLLMDCIFDSNTAYAIKEDAGGRPVVENCTFINNTYIYYRADTGTVIDVEGINSQLRNGSGGNR